MTVSEPEMEERWRGWLEPEEGEWEDFKVALLVPDLIPEARGEGVGLRVCVDERLGWEDPEMLGWRPALLLVEGERREDMG